MKPLLINTYDKGGAANACLRLNAGLLEQNVDTKTLVLKKKSSLNNVVEFEKLPNYSITERIINKYNLLALPLKLPLITTNEEKETLYINDMIYKVRPKGLDTYSLPTSRYDITESRYYQEADIINLHWVSNFLDYPSFFEKNKKPIVWTLHDQNPFIGGEHYQNLIYGIHQNGKPIQRVYSTKELQEEKKHIKVKKKSLENIKNIHIVCLSKWLLESSQSSELFKNYTHHHIPNGFPTDVFQPYNQEFCRQVLNLPKNKLIILFVSEGIHNQRKGFIYLQKALENIFSSSIIKNNIYLCAIGAGDVPAQLSDNVISLGSIQDERIMALAYSAANLFVIPSLEDNLPNTMIESILCGTPTIGFPIGGIVDTIQNNQNGYLCEEVSVKSLETTIEKFIDNPSFFDRQKIAKEAKEKYSLEVQAKKYIELYHSILENH